MSEIRERMKVVDKYGAEVGIVDEVEGDRIKLEQGSDNQHHYSTSSWSQRSRAAR